MTPEQQREQWLKRLLPALGVLVVYFAIISGFVTSKTKKAEGEYKTMVSKGIDASMLPIKQQDQSKLKEELTKLEAEEKSIRDQMTANGGFLASKDTQNDTLDKVSVIFKNNSLQVLEEKFDDKVNLSSLPKSFADMQKYLSELSTTPVTPAPATKPAASTVVKVWTIHYYGSYNNTYRALKALLDSETKVLPVSLTMQVPKNNSNSNGQLEWNLMLWL